MRLLQGDRSRNEILDAAMALVARSSYAGTSIAAISKACGLPASSIYWHFESKAGLFSAVLQRAVREWLAELAAILAAGEDGQTGLHAWLRASALSFKERPQTPRLLMLLSLELRDSDPNALRAVREVRKGAVAMARDMLARDADTRRLDPDRLSRLADFMVSYMHGAFLAHQIDPEHNDLEAAFERLHEIAVAQARET